MTRVGPLLAVALGGAVGTLARWGILESITEDGRSVAVFGCNVVGSLLVGAIAGQRERVSARWHRLLATGFAGGLTTFSTYAVEVASLLDDGSVGAATVTGAVTPIAAVASAGVGYRGSRLAAVAMLGRRRRRGRGRGRRRGRSRGQR
ncbi:MAG: CrcB family protein [Actinomycetota bacterium]